MSAIVLTAQPRLRISSGAIEALKWLALAFMVVDHVNTVSFARDLGPWATAAGRVAFPLFAIVLGTNLARDRADLIAVLKRLVVFGLLAAPGYAALFGQIGWWPLNVMATFAVAVCALLAWKQRSVVGLAVVVLAGAAVEYWWPGVALVLASYAIAKHGASGRNVFAFGSALAALCLINLNAWAILCIPVVAAVAWWSPHIPRSGRFFWWFYPAHLTALALWVGV